MSEWVTMDCQFFENLPVYLFISDHAELKLNALFSCTSFQEEILGGVCLCFTLAQPIQGQQSADVRINCAHYSVSLAWNHSRGGSWSAIGIGNGDTFGRDWTDENRLKSMSVEKTALLCQSLNLYLPYSHPTPTPLWWQQSRFITSEISRANLHFLTTPTPTQPRNTHLCFPPPHCFHPAMIGCC